MQTVEKQRSLSLLERQSNFMFPPCIITVCQASFHLKDCASPNSHSEVLEGPLHISAGEVPWRVAKGRVHAVQLRYVWFRHDVLSYIMNSLQVPGGASGDGASRPGHSQDGEVLIRVSFRFFETESVAVLTMILSRYKVEVKEEPEFIGETFEQRYARVTAFNSKATTA